MAEVDQLLDAAPTDEAHLFVRMLLMTALWPGEAKGLRVKESGYRRRHLLVCRSVDQLGYTGDTNNHRERDMPVGGDLLLDLEDTCVGNAPTAPLLPDELGNVWTTARWRRI